MDNKIFNNLFPGVDEKYLEKAFQKLKENGRPQGEDLLTWFGKLVVSEIISETLERKE